MQHHYIADKLQPWPCKYISYSWSFMLGAPLVKVTTAMVAFVGRFWCSWPSEMSVVGVVARHRCIWGGARAAVVIGLWSPRPRLVVARIWRCPAISSRSGCWEEGSRTSIVNRPELHRPSDQSVDGIETVGVEEFGGSEGVGWGPRELTHIL